MHAWLHAYVIAFPEYCLHSIALYTCTVVLNAPEQQMEQPAQLIYPDGDAEHVLWMNSGNPELVYFETCAWISVRSTGD